MNGSPSELCTPKAPGHTEVRDQFPFAANTELTSDCQSSRSRTTSAISRISICFVGLARRLLASLDSPQLVARRAPQTALVTLEASLSSTIAEAIFSPRSNAIKRYYTQEGNWDWVYNNTPVFFLRDPTKFPLFIHTQKRNPQTNLKDATMFWGKCFACRNPIERRF